LEILKIVVFIEKKFENFYLFCNNYIFAACTNCNEKIFWAKVWAIAWLHPKMAGFFQKKFFIFFVKTKEKQRNKKFL